MSSQRGGDSERQMTEIFIESARTLEDMEPDKKKETTQTSAPSSPAQETKSSHETRPSGEGEVLPPLPPPPSPGGVSGEGSVPPVPSLPVATPAPPAPGPPPPPSPGGGPPPPPPAPGGGPPPPPGGGPAPPPPPGGAVKAAALPKKSYTFKPTTKLRPYYWTKIPANQIKGTIWSTMKDDILLDLEPIESEFSYVNKAKKIEAKEEQKTVILLERKRWQNISIVLNRFQYMSSLEEIRDSIKMNDERLTLEDLQQLSTTIPVSEEIELLKPYKGMKKEELPPNLGLPEQFFLLLMEIPEIGVRLNCWLFKHNFTVRFVEVKQSVENLLRACVAVKKSAKFKRVLEVVLAVGNCLNYDSNRGGCWGFKIKDLKGLSDMRSLSDPQKSLFHYLIEYMNIAYPNDIDFYVDFECLGNAGELQQLTYVREELVALKQGISMIDEFNASPGADYGNFKEVMNKFNPTSKKLVEKIEELLDKGEKLYKEILTYFGEPQTTTLDEFFGEIYRFGVVFEKTRLDLIRRKEAEIRNRQRLEQAKQPKAPMGRLEQAIADLTSGSAFYTKPTPSEGKTESTSKDSESLTPLSTPRGTNKQQPAKQPNSQKEQIANALAFLKK
uniref:FH2 domain-containing protein n=1 Tax=Arcella intermedia TaxID=1963864 RepID=A0A6B2KZQ5_9EUKA